ncbi:TlpA family protein disulfide reductase [Winogradskyella psychrotolerans]|uniref:TlpA family protein disulfide reductase n=1 Tax=Winogradskyella psychrotolerans TaxID=1344585 RepID=UPI001C069796|nr:TlpA disulfide reductase family protein [Winogradskyella psychrotolerans]MBU2928062.1 TlpA family protein disulfide reductase [Winogradskyella psychrotolerans]
MKVSVYILALCLIGLFCSCDTLKTTDPNSISVEILGEAQPDSIKVVSYNNSEGISSKHGNPYTFNFSKAINDAFIINVFKDEKTYSKKVFLNGGRLKIQAELLSESLKIDTVIGSEIYTKSIRFFSDLDSLNSHEINDFDVNAFLLNGVEENLNHPFSFEISNHYIDKNKNYKSRLIDLKSILDKQSDTLKAHTLSVHRVLKDLVKTESLDLSAFEFYNREGALAKIDRSHRGDYLLDFWFVQCPPCVRDHKKMVNYLEEFKKNNVELIGISIDTQADKWLSYLQKHNYDWQNYRELGTDNDLVEVMNVWEFPTYILLNNKGEIITKFYSFEDIQNYYSKL